MLKLKLGTHLSLPKLFLVGLASLAIIPVLDFHAANGQLIRYTYTCQQTNSGGYTTTARSSQGNSSNIIIWERNRQPLCDTVSGRFQEARDNGNLRLIVRDNDRICGTNEYNGQCRNLLFHADGITTAQALWRQLTNGGTVNGRYITQSDDLEYFNLEQYLEDSASSNQAVSKNP